MLTLTPGLKWFPVIVIGTLIPSGALSGRTVVNAGGVAVVTTNDLILVAFWPSGLMMVTPCDPDVNPEGSNCARELLRTPPEITALSTWIVAPLTKFAPRIDMTGVTAGFTTGGVTAVMIGAGRVPAVTLTSSMNQPRNPLYNLS